MWTEEAEVSPLSGKPASAGRGQLIVDLQFRRQRYMKKTEPAKIGLRYVLKRTDVYKKRTFRTQIHVQKRTLRHTTYFVAVERFSAETADENVR